MNIKTILLATVMSLVSLAAEATTPNIITCKNIDDTATLNNALSSPNVTVYGLCAVSGTLTLYGSGGTLSGRGPQNVTASDPINGGLESTPNTSILKPTIIRSLNPGQFNIITVVGTNNTISGITFDGAVPVGSGAAGGGLIPHNSDGIYVTKTATGTVINQVESRNNGDNGIDTAASDTTVSDSVVTGNYHNGIYATGMGGFITGETIQGNYVALNSLAQLPENIVNMPTSWDGIDFDPNVSQSIITKNTVVGNDIIVTITGGPNVETGNQITYNNIHDNPAQTAIDVSGQDHVTIENNQIARVSKYGMIVVGVTNALIEYNNIAGVNGALAGTGQGIILKGFTPEPTGILDNIQIVSNNISGTAPGQPAIYVAGATGVRVASNNTNGAAINTTNAGIGLTLN